jgi:2-methylisocitrate lyase-like PEP mutase family enzyme
MKTTTNLRQLLQAGPMEVAPFILNAMHAKIAEAVGFPAVYMTSAGTAAERDFPDVGLPYANQLRHRRPQPAIHGSSAKSF